MISSNIKKDPTKYFITVGLYKESGSSVFRKVPFDLKKPNRRFDTEVGTWSRVF